MTVVRCSYPSAEIHSRLLTSKCPLLLYWTSVQTHKREAFMSGFRHSVADLIRASHKLLEARDLSDDEEDAVRDML